MEPGSIDQVVPGKQMVDKKENTKETHHEDTTQNNLCHRDYNKTILKTHQWIPFYSKFVFGLRADGQFTSGDVPFYMLPFVDLRGIPALRYQGAHTLVAETELRWDVTKRWSAVGFIGSGWVAEYEFNDFKNSDAYVAGGVGVRYLIAKVFNMRVGADIARGPEDTAFYLTMGSRWK